MIGILTEKPSASRNFAKALGGMSGTFNGEQYRIVAARGHLYEFIEPEKQVSADQSAKYKSWALQNLPWCADDFKWKKKINKGCSSVVSAIKTGLAGCNEIVIASDLDPTGEGSLLAGEILLEAHLIAPKLSRMEFVDESAKSLQDAFKKRKVLQNVESYGDYKKALYRSKWDYMSMQFTRIASSYAPFGTVLRQGRLKSAMVYLVCKQLELVANYKKVPFYQNKFKDENGVVYSWADEPKYDSKDKVVCNYQKSDVVLDSSEIKHQAPPKLLDLAGLSAILSGQGVGAKEVLSVYQKMYEAQIVSYPRTEDKTVTPEQFNELLPYVDKIAGVVGIDPKKLTHRQPRKTHVKPKGAHGANRPGTNVPASLSVLSQYGKCASKIYEILAKNYLSILAEDYEYEQQKGHVKDYPKFIGYVNIPKKLGYKDISNTGDDDLDNNSSVGLGKVASPFIFEGFPPKPANPTMKWLMKQLEKRNVGTGATRTSIYAEVVNTKYKYPLLKETRGRLSDTEYGKMSYLLLEDTNIGDLSITEQVMSDMKDIESGTKTEKECLDKIEDLVRHDIAIMAKNSSKLRKEVGIMSSNFGQIEYAEGVFNGENIRFKRVQRGVRLTNEQVQTLFDGGKVTCEFVSQKTGNPYTMEGGLKKMDYEGYEYWGIDWQFAQNPNFKQPDSKDYYFGNFNGQEIKFKKVSRGHEITQDEVDTLLSGGTISAEFISKKTQKPYYMSGGLAEMEYNGHKYWGVDWQFAQ